jgi:SAM-dependent methyltransferase
MASLAKLFERRVPVFLRSLIEPTSGRIAAFVEQVVDQTNPNSLILDAGAGESRHKTLVKNRKYIAIDAAWGDLNWNYSGLDVIGDLTKLPFDANTFDCILCIQVLEHVADPQMAINELFRALKQGGYLCLTAPQGWGVHQPPHDYFRFTNHALRFLFKKSGFEIIQLIPICGYFGYIANRLTVLPKVLFWQIRNKLLRVALIPFELFSYLVFVMILPIILNAIDFLDKKRDYTLNYMAMVKKPQDLQ